MKRAQIPSGRAGKTDGLKAWQMDRQEELGKGQGQGGRPKRKEGQMQGRALDFEGDSDPIGRLLVLLVVAGVDVGTNLG